ncbi:restriction endonuclease subunit S [Lactococcus lactis]|uniref:restriction endonuclease subunit S n=1 Tax=Lactococcus lactis TaxID=1358 RepID=UPI001F5BCDD2|nr:restriction endonuclease subunit S [Lactococcus lactis]WDA69750.1 restriction endonuclease subunit S [Lactococcus lactis]
MTANQKNKTLDNSVRADEKSAKFDGSLLDLIQDAEVAWIPLGEVCNIQRGKRLVRSQLTETGKYPVYQNSMTPLGFYDEHNFSGDNTFIICAGAAGKIGYMSDDFWAADDVSVLTTPSNLMSRYLYHFLLTQKSSILSKVRRASVPRLSKIAFEKIPIPVPSLEIQQKVVEILDKMTDYVTELTAELTAELTLRQKQYAYYRDQLLTFPSQSDSDESLSVRWTTLGQIAEYSKLRISAAELTEENYVGVDNLLQNRQGKTLSNHVPSERNLTKFQSKDILIGNIRPYLKKIWLSNLTGGSNGDVLVIRTTSDDVNPNYLYQVLSDDKFFNYDMQNSKGAKMPRGNKEAILKYKIPLPNLSEQKRIVEILDKFDKLTSDLSEGLPREIELRKKQYEYWREELLSFRKEY